MEQTNKINHPDLDRIGLFKEMSYIHEYVPVKISFNDASKKGKQMMTNCSRSKGGNQDGYFDRSFQRAFKGEGYIDRIHLNRLYRLKKAEKNLAPGFKYSSPTKKPSGKGSCYGTFVDYDKKMEYFSSQLQGIAKSQPVSKNFYTNPPKKGTGYGYPNVTIGKQPPYFLETEYKDLKNTLRETKKNQPRSFQPFRAGLYKQQYFDPNPYKIDEEALPPKEYDEEQEKTNEKNIEMPFLPSSPAKKDGGMKAGCLNSFPEYANDPLDRIDLVPRGVKMYLNDQNQMFRPVSCAKPYPIKSIITKNVQKKVTPRNFSTVKEVVYCRK